MVFNFIISLSTGASKLEQAVLQGLKFPKEWVEQIQIMVRINNSTGFSYAVHAQLGGANVHSLFLEGEDENIKLAYDYY